MLLVQILKKALFLVFFLSSLCYDIPALDSEYVLNFSNHKSKILWTKTVLKRPLTEPT